MPVSSSQSATHLLLQLREGEEPEEALGQLEEEHPRAARVVECRFFAGMTIEETAEALGVSGSTVGRDWRQARGWLYREMERIRGGGRLEDGETEDA